MSSRTGSRSTTVSKSPAATGQWTTVADASDRRKFAPEGDPAAESSTEGARPGRGERRGAFDRPACVDRTEDPCGEPSDRWAFAGTFRQPDVIHLLRRGDPERPEEPVGPAVPHSVRVDGGAGRCPRAGAPAEPGGLDRQSRESADGSSDGESHLAGGTLAPDWLKPRATSDAMAARLLIPSCSIGWPKKFVRSGWSVKHMHRLIVLSATYRQSTRYDPAAAAGDAEARLLCGFPRGVSTPNRFMMPCSPRAVA